MKKYKRLMVLLVLGFVSLAVSAETTIVVESGNVSQWRAAFVTIASLPLGEAAIIEVVDTGQDYEFGPFESTGRATPVLERKVTMKTSSARRILFIPNPNLTANIGFMVIGPTGRFTVNGNFGFEGWHASDDGGVFRVQAGGSLISAFVRYANNRTDGNGGVISFTGAGTLNSTAVQQANAIPDGNVDLPNSLQFNVPGQLVLLHNEVADNNAFMTGGAFYLVGEALPSDLLLLGSNDIWGNTSGLAGSAITTDFRNDAQSPITSLSNSFRGSGALWDNPGSIAFLINDLFWSVQDGSSAINNTGKMSFFQTSIGAGYGPTNRATVQKSVGGDSNKLLAVCSDFGTNSFTSLGYNIAPDASCGLDQPTDLPNTDPLVGMDAAGLPILLPGSPAIDGGSAEVWQPVPGFPLTLPCPYIDLAGNARPQDANGDGVFECDIGPVEVQGAGAVSSAHSASFFNNLRNGEGTFVELLAGGLAVIYTFTYTPDGSAPAWITTLGHVVGNSIISNGLTITSGTRFGDNFVAADVVRTGLGEMSMVFPDCETNDNKGSVAYTGSLTLGYEALMTRSTRLTNIIGCDGVKSANAGRSGSFFNAARDGEGIIVQWLADGRVVVMFFTYGLDGGQMWVFGVGTPNGATVTLDAVYPTGLSKWGSGFDPAEVVLSPWGTITLTYLDPNNLTFKYNSTVAGYGTNTRNYTRLTNLIDVQ